MIHPFETITARESLILMSLFCDHRRAIDVSGADNIQTNWDGVMWGFVPPEEIVHFEAGGQPGRGAFSPFVGPWPSPEKWLQGGLAAPPFDPCLVAVPVFPSTEPPFFPWDDGASADEVRHPNGGGSPQPAQPTPTNPLGTLFGTRENNLAVGPVSSGATVASNFRP